MSSINIITPVIRLFLGVSIYYLSFRIFSKKRSGTNKLFKNNVKMVIANGFAVTLLSYLLSVVLLALLVVLSSIIPLADSYAKWLAPAVFYISYLIMLWVGLYFGYRYMETVNDNT